MAKIVVRDGKEYFFKDDATEAEINSFFEKQKEIEEKKKEEPPEEKEDNERGILTDVPYSGLVGVKDAGKETLNLIEGLAQSAKKKLGYGGLTFGKNADNGWVQYHSYEDAVKNNIKMPLSGDITKIGDSKFHDFIPEMDTPDTVAGEFTKSITQFVTGWYTGGKLLKPLKPLTKTGKTAKVFAKGAIADFQVFGQDTGRFIDIVNTHAPALQNPIFDYLGSEGKDEGFYEARLKNAIEGVMLGGFINSALKGLQSDQVVNLVKYLKLRKNALQGKPVDGAKLKEVEENLMRSAEADVVPIGKGSKKKFKDTIKKEAGDLKTEQVITKLKEVTSAEQLNEKMVENFNRYIKRIQNKEKGVNWRKIDDNLDFDLSPRAYADGNFGTLALEAISKIVRSERKFDKYSDALIENQALKATGDIIETTKMMGNLGDKLEGGLKYMWGSQSLQMNLADSLYKMANSIRKNEGIYTEQQMKMVTAQTMKLIRFDQKVTSNLGRGLRLRSVLKDMNTDLSHDSILQMVKNFDKYDGNFKEFIEGVALMKDKNALIKITDFLFRNNFWNKVNEVWMSSALSNIKTQAVNVISTGINSVVKPIDSFIGSKMTWGLDTQTAKMVKAEGEVAMQTLSGLKLYLDEGLMFAKKAFNDEDSILFAGSTKFDRMTKALGDGKVARTVRIPLRALTAMDELFKQVNYKSKLMAISVREANNQAKALSKTKIVGELPNGTKVSEWDYFVSQRYKAGFDETGFIGIDKEAKRYAQEVTFTKDLTGMLGKIQEAVNEAPILKQVLPFIKTPANLALQAIERTPLGAFGKNWKHFTGSSADAVRIAEVRGRVTLGSMILLSGSILALNGRITGGYSSDKAIRNAQKNEGFQPYSIKIGNKWFEYGRLDPIGMLIGTMADYQTIYSELNEKDRMEVEGLMMRFMLNQMEGEGQNDIGNDEKISNMAVAGYKSMFKNIASKTYLRSLIDIMTAINGEDIDKQGLYWLENKATSFYPNLFSKVTNDPYIRDAQTLVEKFKVKIGLGMQKDVMKTYNFLGEPIKRSGGGALRLFNNIINPVTIGERKNDVLLQEMIKHDINIPALPKVKLGVDLTKFVDENGKSAYEYWNELMADSNLRKNLEKLIKTSAYENAPSNIIWDKNNKNFGGKKSMVINKVVFERNTQFLKLKFSAKFKSVDNPEMTLGKAFVNRDLIKTIGTVTNKYPKNMKNGIYNFIEGTR
tara:strand:- start:762 stop:4415 length:3654 start_codon:yes stop_codon:yes gene_type:complete